MKFLALLYLPLLPLLLSAQEKSAPQANGKANAQLTDYPRPTLMRSGWTNLNGEWDIALGAKDDITSPPKTWLGKTAVPQAADKPPIDGLDGTKRIWYRRQFETPELKSGYRLHLHCNGVAGEALIMLNGTLLNLHQGTNAPFRTDVTEALTKTPNQELAIAAWSANPKSQAPGITREVWLEAIPRSHIESLKISSDADTGKVTLHASIWGQADFRTLEVRVLDGEKEVAKGNAFYHYKKGGYEVEFTIPEPKLWTPETPKLYGLRIRLANEDKSTHDNVTSYFALRKVANTKDAKATRFTLNGTPVFLLGLEDSANNALLSDNKIRSKLEEIKANGYNLVRKPKYMDSPRFYHWADRVGLLVWQDLPAPGKQERADKTYQQQITNLKKRYIPHPSIAIWPSSHFATTEGIYTAGETVGNLVTGEPDDELPSGKAQAAADMTGKLEKSNQPAIDKLKQQGFSAVIFTGEASE